MSLLLVLEFFHIHYDHRIKFEVGEILSTDVSEPMLIEHLYSMT